MSVLHEEAALELLRADLEESGDGVSAASICSRTGAWDAWRVVGGLRRRGCVVEELPGSRFKLWSEPASTEPSDAMGHGGPLTAVRAWSGGSVDKQLQFEVAA